MSIKLENITHIYGDGTPFRRVALDDVSIEFPEGKITGIIGHTGSGKSTMATMLNGLLKPTGGKIYLDGKDIWEDPKNMRNIRFKVGMVFQYPEYQLFAETVLEDISFGPKNMGLSEEECKSRALRAAEFCKIPKEILNRSPFEISGGQKRRVAVAGVVAMDPDVLVLDEPAAGLDPQGRADILGGMKEYQKQRKSTMLLISHSMEEIAEYADYIAVLKDGKIFMFGTPEEIFSNPQKLFDSSLDLPQITKLFVELYKRKLVNRTDIYTVGYAVKAFLEETAKLEKSIEN